MPPELLTKIADWGFPALLSFYLLYRADKLLTPLVTEAMNLIREISQTMKATADQLGGLINSVGEGTEAALSDHADIHGAVKEQGETIDRIDANTQEILRRIPQAAPASKE